MSNINRTRILALIIACGLGFAIYATLLSPWIWCCRAKKGSSSHHLRAISAPFPAGSGLLAIFLLQGLAEKRGRRRGWPLILAVGLLIQCQTPSLAIFRGRLPVDPIRAQLKEIVDEVRAMVATRQEGSHDLPEQQRSGRGPIEVRTCAPALQSACLQHRRALFRRRRVDPQYLD